MHPASLIPFHIITLPDADVRRDEQLERKSGKDAKNCAAADEGTASIADMIAQHVSLERCGSFVTASYAGSFVMRPQAQNLDGAFNFVDLIQQAMLNVDAARISPHEIPNQLFVRRRILKRIFRDDVEQTFGLGPEIRGRYFFCVFLRLPGVNDNPTHQPGFFEDLESGSAMPLRIDSRMPGIETR